ncbi:MAG TPA: M28 family peptidase [Candidatus Nanopelagicaceae bacterium]|nr:M28 family peptidase [Candidatus Nanopelagicaceae bacterium]
MIDEKRLKENLTIFSFPRLSGTDGEKKALNIARSKVEDLNHDPLSQTFVFSTFFGRAYPKIIFISGFGILFLLFLDINAIIIPISLAFITLLMVALLLFARKPENIRIRNKLNSENLYVKIRSKHNEKDKMEEERKARNILFMCHLDSKGQRFSILGRVRIIRTWVFSWVVLIFILICSNYLFTSLYVLFHVLGTVPLGVNLIATILFLLNTTNDESRGAIDNSSGIACVLELLNYYTNPKSRLENFNLWFVFTGAEECGTMGIRNFYYKISKISKEHSFFFNFDAIARNLYLFPGKKMSKQVETVFEMFLKNKRGIEIKRNPKKIYFGTHSDGYYLKKKKFFGIGIGDMESYEYIHSIHDTVDKVDISLLKNLCEMIIENLIAFDNQT